MSAIKLKKIDYEFNEDEPPLKKLISEGDILIKKLVENQKNTNITLQDHLKSSKQFTKGADITPLSRFNSGTSSLTDILNLTEHFSNIENLKATGLSEQDAQLYLDSLKGFEYLYSNHKNWERSLLEQHLQEIRTIVEEYNQAETSRDSEQKQKLIEYGLSVKPNSLETKLLKFALENTNETKHSLVHPINHIKEVERQCFGHLNEPLPSLSKIRKKSRKLQRRLNKDSSTEQPYYQTTTQNTAENISKWDVKVHVEEQKSDVKKTYTCTPRSYYTVRNGEIVKLTNSELCSKHLEVTPKLSLEEIKKLPKFQDYSPGLPTKVLYLKNLNNSVKVEDLHHIFKEFLTFIIDCKVMKGKLRGQAFITFQDERMACRALEDLNGTFIKNKPVIIQYSCGKRQN